MALSHGDKQLAIRTLEAETGDVRSVLTETQVIAGKSKDGITQCGRGMRGDSFARELR